jgi:hypothetical protein
MTRFAVGAAESKGAAITLDRIAERTGRLDSAMPDSLFEQANVERRALAVTSFAEAERADQACWRSRTPDEHLEALELCRQIAYGYASARHIPALRACCRHAARRSGFRQKAASFFGAANWRRSPDRRYASWQPRNQSARPSGLPCL